MRALISQHLIQHFDFDRICTVTHLLTIFFCCNITTARIVRLEHGRRADINVIFYRISFDDVRHSKNKKKAFLSHLLADGASEEKLRCCKLIIKNEIENNLHWQHSIKQNRSKIAEKAMIDFKIPMILGKSER